MLPHQAKKFYPLIIQLYKEGKSYNEICKIVGCSKTTIGFVVRNFIEEKRYNHRGKKYTLDDNYFDAIDTENKAYLLGLMYADGFLAVRNQIGISLAEEDKYILDFFKKEIKYDGNLRFKKKAKPNHKNSYLLQFSSYNMSNKLKSYGCVIAKSLILKFPSFDSVPKHLIRHFIRGYFDGDGCCWFDNDKGLLAELIGTQSFCETLKEYLSEINITSYIGKRKGTEARSLRMSTRSSILFYDHIYKNSNFKMKRKYDLFINYMKNYNKAIKANGSRTSDEVYSLIINYWKHI